MKMRSISKTLLKKPEKLEVVLDGNGEIGKILLRQLAEPTLGCSESGTLNSQSPAKASLGTTLLVAGQ